VVTTPCNWRRTLTVEAVLVATGQTGLMFVAADQDLVVAANAEGLSSDDPHLHP
jgi:hypothetical protein